MTTRKLKIGALAAGVLATTLTLSACTGGEEPSKSATTADPKVAAETATEDYFKLYLEADPEELTKAMEDASEGFAKVSDELDNAGESKPSEVFESLSPESLEKVGDSLREADPAIELLEVNSLSESDEAMLHLISVSLAGTFSTLSDSSPVTVDVPAEAVTISGDKATVDAAAISFTSEDGNTGEVISTTVTQLFPEGIELVKVENDWKLEGESTLAAYSVILDEADTTADSSPEAE